MHLERVRVRSFRNLADLEFHPGAGVCVLYGDNAQGKTNLLEAVYLLSNLQSFRTRRVKDLISFGAERARVEGVVRGRNGASRLQVDLDQKGRTVRCDGSPPSSTSAYLSELHTVLFTPLDLDLARGNQELRRRFLDRAAFLSDPAHLTRVRSYNRALRQRNALLRSGQPGLEAWDERLASLGAAVHRARRRIVAALAPVIGATQEEISGGNEEIQIAVDAPYGGDEEPAASLLRLLREGWRRDTQVGHTRVGPHRDAVQVTIDGKPVERYGSQGQQRTLALSLKLSLLQHGREVLGEDPVFLLDDPGSELDAERLSFLGRFLSRWRGQVIITGTEEHTVPLPREPHPIRYRVAAGRIQRAGDRGAAEERTT